MYSQEGNGNGQREQEVTSPTHYIFEQFQNSYQFRTPFTNPEKIFEPLCPFKDLCENIQNNIVNMIDMLNQGKSPQTLFSNIGK